MKKVWKWILGILVGLVVIAVVLGAGYLVARRVAPAMWMRENRLLQRSETLPALPRQKAPGQNMPEQNWSRNFGRNDMPMQYYGRMGLRPFGGLLFFGRLVGGVFKLAILGLVIFLAVTLALRQKPVKQPVAASPAQAAMLSCPNCGHAVQADWKHCPNCGNSLEPAQPEAPEA
jgi:hypothetical protein